MRPSTYRTLVAALTASVFLLGAQTSPKAQEPSKSRAEAYVAELVTGHNRERAEAGKPPLKPNDLLAKAAMVHARDMAEHEMMSHEGSDGSSASERIERQGYRYQRVGENVAFGQEDVAEVVRAWMKSPHHRDNILGDFEEMGVACAFSAEGVPYWCVTFGTPWPRLDPEKAAATLVEAFNQARAEAKKSPLTADPKLQAIALRHARDMAAKGKLASKDSDGLTPFERIQRQGLAYRMLGISNASGHPQAADVAGTLLGDAAQKAHVLGNFTRVGVGYATAKDGTPYWSIIFGRPAGR